VILIYANKQVYLSLTLVCCDDCTFQRHKGSDSMFRGALDLTQGNWHRWQLHLNCYARLGFALFSLFTAGIEVHQSRAWDLQVHVSSSVGWQDLPGALDAAAVTEALNLHTIKNRQWSIFKTSAIKGDGLFEGLDWYDSETSPCLKIIWARHWGCNTSRFVFSCQTGMQIGRSTFLFIFYADMYIRISIDFANRLTLWTLWSGSAILWSRGKSSEDTVSETVQMCDGTQSLTVCCSLASVIGPCSS